MQSTNETTTEATDAPLSAEQAPRGGHGAETAPEAATRAPSGPHGAPEADPNPSPRPWTPDRTNADGSTTIKMKRACNGCGTQLGDVTDQEMARGINGLPLPDVRRECPTCGPTAPEPRCLPVETVDGDRACLDQDCGHDIALDTEYCVEVAEHTICLTHSAISHNGVITRAEPWPCQHTKETAR